MEVATRMSKSPFLNDSSIALAPPVSFPDLLASLLDRRTCEDVNPELDKTSAICLAVSRYCVKTRIFELVAYDVRDM